MKQCVICGNELTGYQQKYCGQQCRYKHQNSPEYRKKPCSKCGTLIYARKKNFQTCNNCTQRTRYTIEELKDAVASSSSIAQVLSKLDVVVAGGNYASIRSMFKKHAIDTSHFTGQGWSKGKSFKPKRPLQDYLDNKYAIASHSLRQRLLSEGIFERKCYGCNLTEWFGNEIPLELDHINGVHEDNTLSNLRLLCPNCHALTDTYRGKNKKK